MIDSAGNVEDHIEYNAFGLMLSHSDPNQRFLLGYAGYVWDPDTGAYNARLRWYDASTGKWLSEDPIGFLGGDYNISRYVGNGPTNATDPSGLHVADGGVGTYDDLRDVLDEAKRNSTSIEDFIDRVEEKFAGYNRPGRFVYTTKWGWVDMRHLIAAYKYDSMFGGIVPSGTVLSAGVQTECDQADAGDESAWGVEDLPSNKLGTLLSSYWHVSVRGLIDDLFDLLGEEGKAPASIEEFNEVLNLGYQPLLDPKSKDVKETNDGIKSLSSGDIDKDEAYLRRYRQGRSKNGVSSSSWLKSCKMLARTSNNSDSVPPFGGNAINNRRDAYYDD